ncbi:LysR family transcriptional regulator [Mesorhizobium camelthorni]|uniref:LysR family transcriptional regulator n=1 Tax=Allomesorhizobium camelthorni TaxID=475069 RepID=A0A6G4WMQ2_9HYPH|nr:LysR family transcriptional regulator [Mesorhizobium camelthorni]
MRNAYAIVKLSFMQRLRSTLPSPNLLVSFEAAGRLLSFTRAATELNVTRVAVSQQIRALEDFLGVPLFHRLHRALSLTQVGERYHRAISGALEQAVRATAEISKHADKNMVNVTATAGFTTYWLMPNIGGFRQKHPEIELRFVISDRYLDLVEENIDVAIRYGTPPFSNVNADHLVREVIAPTCAGDFVQSGQQLPPEDMARHPLIHLDGPYEEQTRWSHWFRTQGLEWRASQGGITVNTYTNLVQAVLDGQGFALIGMPLIARFLASGSLVQPVLAPAVLRHSFYLVTPNNHRPSKAASAFCDWVRRAFDATANPD